MNTPPGRECGTAGIMYTANYTLTHKTTHFLDRNPTKKI